jgi:hypothetical protein
VTASGETPPGLTDGGEAGAGGVSTTRSAPARAVGACIAIDRPERQSVVPPLLAVIAAAFALLLLIFAVPSPSARADVAPASAALPLKEMLGVNGVVNNDPSGMAQVAGWVRDYHKWYWYEPAADEYRWEGGWQRLGDFYRALQARDVKVMPVVEFAPAWASSNGQKDGIPDAHAHASYLGNLVRYFGDTLAAVENYNEPNQWWQPVRFPAADFGAMTVHDYAAVKDARASTRFVLGGMAGADTAYLDQAIRASDGAFDVVSFHWYAAGDSSNGGKNPESGGLLDEIRRLSAWRDAKAPGRAIWLTEFGWDTVSQPDGRKSKVYAPEASAANYLVRALVLMQAHGVERGFAFLYRDPSDNAAYLHHQYLSAGLVTNIGEKDGRKKPAWYYLATLKHVLGDYAPDGIVADGPNVYHYEYRVPGTSRRAAVLWARDGKRDAGYAARYQGPAGVLVEPVDGSVTGVTSQTDGDLTLSERPVFILYAGDGPSGLAR